MSAIDIHTHAFPDKVAPRAIKQLEAVGEWQAVGDGTVADLLKSMDAADVDISAVCAIATKPDQVKGILKWCKKIRSDRIDPLPSVHPQTPKPGKWLDRFAKAEFAGIKLHPMYQDFALDDPVVDPIFDAAADLGLFVAVHSGFDIAFPQDDRASVPRILRRIERHKGLKLLCTHLGSWKDWDRAEQMLLGADVYVETSFSLQFLEPDRATAMIRKHGTNRVLFGTDWPWRDQKRELARLARLNLTKQERRQVLWANAARLLRY